MHLKKMAVGLQDHHDVCVLPPFIFEAVDQFSHYAIVDDLWSGAAGCYSIGSLWKTRFIDCSVSLCRELAEIFTVYFIILFP
jgi:hypothetical protein